MSLYRNLSAIPIDGLPDGRQILAGDDIDLDKETLAAPLVAQAVQQGTLVPVTMAPVASTSSRRNADHG